MAVIAVDYLCSIPKCNTRGYARWVCKFHYDRKRRLGSFERPCITCGADLGSSRGNVKYCSEDCVPFCYAPGCNRKRVAKHGRCGYHNVNMHRYGSLEPGYTIAERRKTCIICESPIVEESGRREFCSGACYERCRTYGVTSPNVIYSCKTCGVAIEIDLSVPGTRLNRQTSCLGCRTNGHGGWSSARSEFIAKAELTDCGICGEPIDYSLAFPDRKCATVDHIVPRSRGGSHALGNLQYAHSSCNSIKRDKINFKIEGEVSVQ